MSNVTLPGAGAVVSLRRYPVKSMQGEELTTAQVKEFGLLGDRAYALLDNSDGRIATAKNPRKWPNLFAWRAAFVKPPDDSGAIPPVRLTLPDGTQLTSEQGDLNQALSKALNRDVTFLATERSQVVGVQSSMPPSWSASSEEYWADMDGLDHRDEVTEFSLPAGTFFDTATVHLLTTATLNHLHSFYPQGRFELPRFRPNIVVEAAGDGDTFAENAWIGHKLAIGDEVILSIDGPCPRCVMTTLPQGDLPKDLGILRTAVQHNGGNIGVYASVVHSGTIRGGAQVRLVD